ncbi:MAG: peroxiredoxin [Nitrosopumilus sp. B06]|nr:MAG: peroxiredoxin [Nitrosopumilus sp. B06]
MKEGDIAPDFELPAHDGEAVRLGAFRGKKNTVLCFYPKNHLFGCPSKKVFKMAQSIISAYSEIESANTIVLAISTDTVDAQARFVKEYSIPYVHLSDTTKETCKQYAGLNIVGLARRSTFIIDRKGKICKIFRDIDAESHGTEILDFLKQMS